LPIDPPSSPEPAEVAAVPVRAMGFRDLVLFYVVTGLSLRWISTAASHGPSSLVVWLLGFLFLYVPLALSVIELSSRYPAEGGFYVWTKKAFGQGAGFLSAWMYWVSNLPYFPAVLYFAASNVLFLHPALRRFSAKPGYFIAFSVFCLVGLTALNILGLNLAKWVNNLGGLAMWIPALIIMILGFASWSKFGSATVFSAHSFIPSTHAQDMIFWSVVIFAFTGSETASVMAEEIKDARRNLPRAIVLAGFTIAVCYILGSFSLMLAMPSAESSNLDGLAAAIAKAASRFNLAGVTGFAAVLIALSNIGAAGAFIAVAARLPFVAGIDGYLPKAFGRLHPRFKTPWVSILVQGLVGILFVFLAQPGTTVSGAYDVLVAIAVVVTMVPFLFLFGSMIRLTRQAAAQGRAVSAVDGSLARAERRPVQLPGGRPVAVLLGCVGFATAAFAMVLSLVPPAEEPHKGLYLVKIMSATAFLTGLGVLQFVAGRPGQDPSGSGT
jgi:amino acid transporter